jgi:rubrerythrin
MDIFEFAIQMEKDGESYYREIALKTNDKGLTTIMTLLADEEVKHRRIIQDMKTRTPYVPETRILDNVMNIFVQMKEEKNRVFDPKIKQVELYRKAQELEKKSEDFYREKSAQVAGPGHKDLLLKIAEEEKRHYFILENVIDFVNRPQQWLENAEFAHLENY